MKTVIHTEELTKTFAVGSTLLKKGKTTVCALDRVSLDIGEGEIVEVFGKGYQRGGRVIRHSIVKVAN